SSVPSTAHNVTALTCPGCIGELKRSCAIQSKIPTSGRGPWLYRLARQSQRLLRPHLREAQCTGRILKTKQPGDATDPSALHGSRAYHAWKTVCLWTLLSSSGSFRRIYKRSVLHHSHQKRL
ncbi:hypothetical protein A4X09_0g7629, partial [Tilletia walkeri]